MANHAKTVLQDWIQVFVGEFMSKLFKNSFFRKFGQILIDGMIVGTSFWIAFVIRFDLQIPSEHVEQFLLFLPGVVFLYLGSNFIWKTYRLVWHFIGLRDSVAIAQSVAFSAVVSFGFNTLFPHEPSVGRVPVGVVLLQPLLTYGGWVSVRLARRMIHEWEARQKRFGEINPSRKRLLLVGAGQAGLNLLQDLRKRTDFEMVGFLDDKTYLQGRVIEGCPVLGSTEEVDSIVEKYSIDEVTLCMPSASRLTLQRIVSHCQKLTVKTTTVPTLSEILLGKVALRRLRPVKMEDLLERKSITYPGNGSDKDLIKTYRGSRILVTGAGGSIGSELNRQLRDFDPSQLILLDKDENSLYETHLEISGNFPDTTAVVGDIRDLDRLENIFQQWRPEVVFHAAAYKHVPLMESHPAEAILNNIIGTRNVVDLARKYAVKSFVLISTDKAVNPTSIMGASKRVAEMVIQQRASRGGNTRCCGVRFGNVLGSRASVIPTFQKLIKEGKNITVTHPEIRRYFMTIPEAVQLVIQAGSLADQGEIFVLDMGTPVKIVDLARNLIELSGLVPDRDIKIEFTGLRPGEKLYEELLASGEIGARSTKFENILVAESLTPYDLSLDRTVKELEEAANANDNSTIRRILQSLGIGYEPDPNGSQVKQQGTEEQETMLP